MEKPKPHGIVFPFPYQGHVTPMINLSTKLASKGFTITFVQNEFIHHSISKAQHLPPADVDLFVEARKSGLDITLRLSLMAFPEFDRDLNYDLYWETMFQDFPGPTIAKKYNMVNVSLWTEPAIVFSVNYHLDLLRHNGHFPYSGDGGDRINYLPGVHSISRRDLMSYIQDPDVIPMLIQVVMKGFDQVKEADIILCNTVEELESETLSAQNQKHPTYSIGPINFYTDFTNTTIARSLWSESDCTQWLNSKPPGSVLYVSFGSIAQSSKQEIAEFAHGLLLSKVDFVWIIRPDAIGENGMDDILPTGFEDAIRDRGLIVRGAIRIEFFLARLREGFDTLWLEFSTGKYMPTNRKLVVDDWKIGINLCDGEHVTREEVANKINVLMSGERSTEMKERSRK
ncbi:hypothetical protein DH2020_004947 [Rehmannia glutinosa]|uniref:UDP-glycosyltransferase n=1 Tax=Rehmannia glutinosa TaxID=99300 RepID=A0ABR0XR66_REHGL